MKLKHLLVCTTACLAFSATAAPASDATIEELFQVTHVASLLDGMKAQVKQSMQSSMAEIAAKENFTPEQQRVFQQFSTKAEVLINEEVSWSKLKPSLVQIYRDVYTQEELEGILAFYRSPIGQAMIQKMPRVMRKSMELSQHQMVALIPKIQAALKEAEAEAKATPSKDAPKAAE